MDSYTLNVWWANQNEAKNFLKGKQFVSVCLWNTCKQLHKKSSSNNNNKSHWQVYVIRTSEMHVSELPSSCRRRTVSVKQSTSDCMRSMCDLSCRPFLIIFSLRFHRGAGNRSSNNRWCCVSGTNLHPLPLIPHSRCRPRSSEVGTAIKGK